MKIISLRNSSQLIEFSKFLTHSLIPSQEGTYRNPLLRGADAKHQGYVNTTQKLKYFFVISFLLIQLNINAQTLRETRAVWVSTNYKLDWPPQTYDENAQKETLINIFNNIESKNLNTIYFQVRSNGTVLFKSSLELFSPYIAGEVGKFGGYDPLEFAIQEAHKRGLEIHAVINTMRVFSGNDISAKNNPLHISQIHPEWVYSKSDDNSLWLNPGIPAVRDYLIQLIDEIVENYNVDGIQLDFIRYPQKPINDNSPLNDAGRDENASNWRRNNITKFITQLNQKIKATNPKIKLGVTPIGIYKSIANGRGLEGFNDVFQDTREWLRLGIIDYAVPQIYWDAKTNPKFDVLAKDWIENSFGKNIIIGIGAYKSEVLNEIEREINITRTLESSGMAFFRFKNIEQKRFYTFEEKTLPSEMPWIENIPKLVELNLASNFGQNKISLNFNIEGKSKSDKGYFAIYEHENSQINSNNELIKVVPNYISEMSFLLPKAAKINYFYSAMQFDQLWNETSKNSNIIKITIPKLKEIEQSISIFDNPILLQNGNTSKVVIFSNQDETISLHSNPYKNQNSFLSKHFLKKGFNEINLNYNFNKYKNISIHFLNNNRAVSLRSN
ncbi:MAG: family 10 glycosylhydrolase [Bacteroidetes bacterium]|nr:family 10 glycosylhydrolase [Bacteroidota bacterium]